MIHTDKIVRQRFEWFVVAVNGKVATEYGADGYYLEHHNKYYCVTFARYSTGYVHYDSPFTMTWRTGRELCMMMDAYINFSDHMKGTGR